MKTQNFLRYEMLCLLLCLPVIGFSQAPPIVTLSPTNIDASLVDYTTDLPYVAFNIVMKNIKKVKGNNVGTNDYFSLGTRGYKNIKSRYYFWVVPQFMYVNYSYKNQRSEVAPLFPCKVVDSTFLVSFFQTFNDNTVVEVIKLSSGKVGVTLKRTNRFGKTKVYISSDVIFEKKHFN